MICQEILGSISPHATTMPLKTRLSFGMDRILGIDPDDEIGSTVSFSMQHRNRVSKSDDIEVQAQENSAAQG